MDVIEYAGDDKSHVFLDHTSKLRNLWKRWCLYALNLYYIRLHIYYIQLHIHLHIFICCIDRMYIYFFLTKCMHVFYLDINDIYIYTHISICHIYIYMLYVY